MLGYTSLAEVYKLSFIMKIEHNYSKEEFYSMLPYERDFELMFLIEHIQKKERENK